MSMKILSIDYANAIVVSFKPFIESLLETAKPIIASAIVAARPIVESALRECRIAIDSTVIAVTHHYYSYMHYACMAILVAILLNLYVTLSIRRAIAIAINVQKIKQHKPVMVNSSTQTPWTMLPSEDECYAMNHVVTRSKGAALTK